MFQVTEIIGHGLFQGLPKDGRLDEIGERKRQNGLQDKHVHGNLFHDAANVGTGAKEPRKPIVVNEILRTTLVESSIEQ